MTTPRPTDEQIAADRDRLISEFDQADARHDLVLMGQISNELLIIDTALMAEQEQEGTHDG
jgi:hypothetical protein